MLCWESLLSGHLGPLLLKSPGVSGWFYSKNFSRATFFCFLGHSVGWYVFELFACETNLKKERRIKIDGLFTTKFFVDSENVSEKFLHRCSSVMCFFQNWYFSTLVGIFEIKIMMKICLGVIRFGIGGLRKKLG